MVLSILPMFTLTLLPTVLFSVQVVTNIDCEITDEQDFKDWGATKYGKDGGANGGYSKAEGRLFEFDCQTWECRDSENEKAHEWVTCGYSWRESSELSDSSEVIVDVITEAYNSDQGGDGCPDDFTRWMFLNPTGWDAVDTAGDEGHRDFHFCYKTATWSSVKNGDRIFVTSLYADTTGDGESGYDQIAKWDTNNYYDAKAYGDGGKTRGYLYLFSKKAEVSLPVTLIGYWTFRNQPRMINEYDYHLKESAESSKRQKMTYEESKAWHDEIRTNHRITVTTNAKGLIGKMKVGGSFGYNYEYEHTHSSQFESHMSQLFDETFTQSIQIEQKVKIPAQTDKIKDSNIWYFETLAINSEYDWAKRDMVRGGLEMAGCGYNIGPNCLPGHINWDADPHGWVCKEPFAVIDPTFEIPYLEVGGVCMKSKCRLSSPITGSIDGRNIKCYDEPLEKCAELCSEDLNCKSIDMRGSNHCCLGDCKAGEKGCVNDQDTNWKYYECERYFESSDSESKVEVLPSNGKCAQGRALTEAQCKSLPNGGEFADWDRAGTWELSLSETCGCYIDTNGERYFNRLTGVCNKWDKGQQMICKKEVVDHVMYEYELIAENAECKDRIRLLDGWTDTTSLQNCIHLADAHPHCGSYIEFGGTLDGHFHSESKGYCYCAFCTAKELVNPIADNGEHLLRIWPLTVPSEVLPSNGKCAQGKALTEAQCRSLPDGSKFAEWHRASTWDGSYTETCGCYIDDNGKRYFNRFTGFCNKWDKGEQMICKKDSSSMSSDSESKVASIRSENDRLKNVNEALKKALEAMAN